MTIPAERLFSSVYTTHGRQTVDDKRLTVSFTFTSRNSFLPIAYVQMKITHK